MKIKLYIISVITTGLCLSMTPALAQLEEIIVTAQKREESIQDVAISISALTEEGLEKAAITRTEELGTAISGVNMMNTGGYLIPVIRGMGSIIPGGAVYMGSTINVDGVYIPRSYASNVGVNTSSVQVLKGPQGALYGKNSTGGSIVIETRRPEVGVGPSGNVKVGYGEHDAIDLSVYAATGLTDNTALSLEGFFKEHDPFYDFLPDSQNPARGGIHDLEEWGLTGKLLFEQDNISVLLKGSYLDQLDGVNVYYGLSDRELPSAAQIRQIDPRTAPGGPLAAIGLDADTLAANGLSSGEVLMAGILGGGFGLPPGDRNTPFLVIPTIGPIPTAIGTAAGIDFSRGRGGTHANLINSNEIAGAGAGGALVAGTLGSASPFSGSGHQVEETAFSGRIDIDFERFTLTSITAYADIDYFGAAGVGNIDPSSPGAVTLGLLGLPNLGLGFTGQYENDMFQEEIRLVSNDTWDWDWLIGFNYFNEQQLHGVDGNSFGGFNISTRNEWETTSYAVYGQITYPFTGNWSVTLGGRYNRDELELQDHTDLTNPFTNPVLVILNANAGLIEREDDKFTYTARLEYKTDSWMFYGGTSTGFKSAYLNADGPAFGVSEPEEVTSYEIGFKSQWMGGNLLVNGAVWYYDYENPHISFIDNNVGGQVIYNVPEGELYGAELDLSGLINDGLTWYVNMTITDSEYEQDSPFFNTLAGTSGFAATNGKKFAGAPPFTLAAGLDYRVPFLTSGELSITPSLRYNVGSWYDAENRVGSGGTTDAGYATVNLNMQYIPNNGNWKLGFYGRNLFDEGYFKTGAVGNGFLLFGVPGDPRQLGGYIAYDF